MRISRSTAEDHFAYPRVKRRSISMKINNHLSGGTDGTQTEASIRKNSQFFLEEYDSYKKNIASIDTYSFISAEINKEIGGVSSLLDVGNGGVFDYDTSLVDQITGLDLFLDDLPKDIALPPNVKMIQGSALSIPNGMEGFDGVIMVMLIHHLIGKSVAESIRNVEVAIQEAYRVLRPGGKLIIAESCVPLWFFVFEKLVFKPTSWVIERSIKHPPALQYTESHILEMITSAGFRKTGARRIPKGRFVLQYGVKVPSFITPVQPFIFVGVK